MSERRRSAFLGMFFGYASLALSLARNVLLVPVYLRSIPLPEYGAWLATGGALALILINDYGFSGVVTQRISASYGAREFNSVGRLTGSALAISTLLSLLLSALSLAFVPFLPGVDSLPPEQSHTVANCFVLAIAANALGVIGGTATSVIRSLQKAALSGSIMLVAEIANVIIILAGLAAGFGLYAIAAGVLMRATILSVAGLFAVWLVCARGLAAPIEIRSGAVRDLIGESSRFFLSSIAIKLMAQANVFFVGSILGPASAAIYSLTVRAFETVGLLATMVTGSLVAPITHLFGSGNLARFRAVIVRVLVLLSALTAFMMTLTVVLNPAFLSLWVGARAFAGESVSVLTGIALFVGLVGGVAYDALLAQGKFSRVTRYFVFTSALQVGLLLTLLRLGMWVAPLVSLLTSLIWTVGFWTQVSTDIDLVAVELRRLAAQIARPLSVSVVCAAGFGAFYPAATTWAALIVEGLACGACLTAAYLVISPELRTIAREEIGLTSRMFRAT